MLSTRIATASAVALLAFPAAAGAHVTVQPAEVPAGAFERLDVRVPNERDDASTREVQVRFPAGFIFVSYEPVPGWETEVEMAELTEPVEAFGEQHTQQVATVTWSTDGDGIAPGQFRDFGLSVGLPDAPDTTLDFKALQTYDDGEVVRWIGAPDADQPAAQVELTAASAEAVAASGAHDASQAAPPAAAGDEGADGGGDTLALAALVVGGLGLLAGLAAFAVARRGRPAATA